MALKWKVKFKISKRDVCISLSSMATMDFVSLAEERVGLNGLHSYQYKVLGTVSDISIVMYKQHVVRLP